MITFFPDHFLLRLQESNSLKNRQQTHQAPDTAGEKKGEQKREREREMETREMKRQQRERKIKRERDVGPYFDSESGCQEWPIPPGACCLKLWH